MRSWKRIFYFLLLNVIVSALTTWLVVSLLLKDYPQVPLPQPFAGGGDSTSQNGGGENATVEGTDDNA